MLARARPLFLRSFLCLLLLAWVSPNYVIAQSQWTQNGVPVCVLPDCGGRLPMICKDGNGGAMIAWLTDRDGNEDIYVRRVLKSGTLAPGWSAIGTPAT